MGHSKNLYAHLYFIMSTNIIYIFIMYIFVNVYKKLTINLIHILIDQIKESTKIYKIK